VVIEDLPPRLRTAVAAPPSPSGSSLRAIELDLFERTVAACGGNRSEAARRLGVDRSTVYRRLTRARRRR
jgi:sigma-54 dependent transcriptional regulator, acetoin dehydrogenase operon transcriptional activator AcoR